ncbi:AraC family transcriptional regulator [Novosphingobium sp.]|uniref:helix-turn-helix domain-containing protein n=1 Tax=Novosphingobium sp. TaxID=1874826 RepID=UPI00260B0A79|nr:AraC family transcriptional regulator [Novosphingobium sp.]
MEDEGEPIDADPTALLGNPRLGLDPRLKIEASISLADAIVVIARLNHAQPACHRFRRDEVYWLDLCLTPRRPNAVGRYTDHWGTARFARLGSLLAFPPQQALELRSPGGRHASLICALRADSVERWFPPDFAWTDRRLEATLNIACEVLVQLMTRLNHELRNPGEGHRELCSAIVQQIAIELGRYLGAASEPDERGGLAAWRLRLIEARLSDPEQAHPTVQELAAICRLSTRQFARAFRASRGCSPADYLAQARIESAKRRLYSAEPLARIAASLGFATQSSFCAAFRKATGVTPGQFRKRLGTG